MKTQLEKLQAGEIQSIKCNESEALAIISSDGTAEFGIEEMDLPDGTSLRYTNTGDTYSEALCSIDGGDWFLSCWGDCYESAEQSRYEETGEQCCCYCGEFAELEEHSAKNWHGWACQSCRENH